MIIGRAGGLGDGPREKVAGTEEQISLPEGEEALSVPGVQLNFLSLSLYGEGALQKGPLIKRQRNLQFV